MNDYQAGDHVSVDLTGMVLAYCESCEKEVLALPEGDGYECCGVGCQDRSKVMRLRDITEDDIEYP